MVFLLGRQAYELVDTPINKPRKPYKTMAEYCNTYLDDDQFIGYEFKKQGYTTMMSEDWNTGVFNWPSCMGFKKAPTDHYMR